MVQQGRSLVDDVSTKPAVRHAEPMPQEEVPVERIDEVVDMVIADHQVVVGDLEARIRREVTAAGFTHPVEQPSPPKVTRRRWDEEELVLDDAILQDRRDRARWLRELRPELTRPVIEPPVVTRLGVVQITPDFTQARGIGQPEDVAVLRAGILSAERFLDTPDTELKRLTGLSLSSLDRAKRDLDLVALPGVQRDAANLLRLAGIHSVSRLAAADPVVLAREVARLAIRHRFLEVPTVLADEEAVARLVAAAKGRA